MRPQLAFLFYLIAREELDKTYARDSLPSPIPFPGLVLGDNWRFSGLARGDVDGDGACLPHRAVLYSRPLEPITLPSRNV